MTSDKASEQDSNDESDTNSCDATANGTHPAEGERKTADGGDGEEGNERGSNVGEPFGTEEGHKWSEDEVDNANDPLVFVQPAETIVSQILKIIESVVDKILDFISEILLVIFDQVSLK